MKIPVPAFAILLAAMPLAAQTQPKLKVEKLSEGIWVAQPEQGANVGWFTVSDGVVVVDAGNDAAIARAVLAEIAKTAAKPVRYLIITHAHGDHANGAPVFAAAGAQIICHENAAGAAAQLLRASASTPTSPAVMALSERLVFFGGSRRAAVYYLGAGHTNGDLVVLLPEDKVLFSGDLVVNGRLPYMQSADADPRGWEQILARIAGLDIQKVVPGHGSVGTKQSIGDTLSYVRRVNQLATLFIDTQVPEEFYGPKLREPDNRIENVPISADHIANVAAAVKKEKARLEKPAPTPVPAARPTAAPVPARSPGAVKKG